MECSGNGAKSWKPEDGDMTDGSIMPLGSAVRSLPILDRVIRGLLLVYIFSLPFKGLLVVERNGFLVLLFLLGIWCLAHRDHFFRQTPIDIPLTAFVLWVALTIPFATYPLYSLQEFGKLLQQFLIFYVVLFFFRDHVYRIQLARLLLIGLVLMSAYGVFKFDETLRGGGSLLMAEVWLTTYLIMLIPLGFALAWYEERAWVKNACILVTVLATGCLFLTESRAGLLAFLAELWACVWLLKRRVMLITASSFTLAVVAGIIFLVTLQVSPGGDGKISVGPIPLKTATLSFVHRVDIAMFTLSEIAEHPLLGIGYGKETYKRLFGGVPEENLPSGHFPVRIYGTHNILLELALHAGLPGLALFLWLMISLGRTLIEGFRLTTDAYAKAFLLGASVGLIGLGVRLQFDQLLVGTLAVQFWVLIALAMATCNSLPGNIPSFVVEFLKKCRGLEGIWCRNI
jgi:putative inorganic carbon (HCO3(-)) transporter